VSALLPCPFCLADAVEGCVEDGDSLDNGGHFIQCTEAACGATTPLRFACGDDPKPLLREQWNRRASITLTPDDEAQVEAVARAICLESEGSEDRWFDYEPEAKSAIRTLKEMKR
jgi:hypothetical protein